MAQDTCPCTSKLAFKDCCQPFLTGKAQPSTTEQLLRARYTAFATGKVDYIIQTHHSKTRGELKRDEIESWSKGSEWKGLEIVQKEAGEAGDSEGTIIFHAFYTAEGKDHDHFEKSFFEREDGQWRFVDAQGVHTGPIRREGPKIGRNDPCACGSGKKFKKCCAA